MSSEIPEFLKQFETLSVLFLEDKNRSTGIFTRVSKDRRDAKPFEFSYFFTKERLGYTIKTHECKDFDFAKASLEKAAAKIEEGVYKFVGLLYFSSKSQPLLLLCECATHYWKKADFGTTFFQLMKTSNIMNSLIQKKLDEGTLFFTTCTNCDIGSFLSPKKVIVSLEELIDDEETKEEDDSKDADSATASTDDEDEITLKETKKNVIVNWKHQGRKANKRKIKDEDRCEGIIMNGDRCSLSKRSCRHHKNIQANSLAEQQAIEDAAPQAKRHQFKLGEDSMSYSELQEMWCNELSNAGTPVGSDTEDNPKTQALEMELPFINQLPAATSSNSTVCNPFSIDYREDINDIEELGEFSEDDIKEINSFVEDFNQPAQIVECTS